MANWSTTTTTTTNGGGPPSEKHRWKYAIVDLEGLVLDVTALALAAVRQVAPALELGESTPELFVGRSLRDAVDGVYRNCKPPVTDVKARSQLVAQVLEEVRRRERLVRPRFGTLAFLRFLCCELKLKVLFVSANASIVSRALEVPPPSKKLKGGASRVSLLHFIDADWKPPQDCGDDYCNDSLPSVSGAPKLRIYEPSSGRSSDCSQPYCFLTSDKIFPNGIPSLEDLKHHSLQFLRSNSIYDHIFRRQGELPSTGVPGSLEERGCQTTAARVNSEPSNNTSRPSSTQGWTIKNCEVDDSAMTVMRSCLEDGGAEGGSSGCLQRADTAASSYVDGCRSNRTLSPDTATTLPPPSPVCLPPLTSFDSHQSAPPSSCNKDGALTTASLRRRSRYSDHFKIDLRVLSAYPSSVSFLSSVQDVHWPILLDRLQWHNSGDGPSAVKFPQPFPYPSKVEPFQQHGPPMCLERLLWGYELLPLTFFEGKVVNGFGRGSAQLGIPTANMDCNSPAVGPPLPFPGIYMGFGRLSAAFEGIPTDKMFDMVMSVGYNPYFDNPTLTMEPFLFHSFSKDFYGGILRIVVIGVIRPEANYPSFEFLIQAIQHDCELARSALQQLRNSEPDVLDACRKLLFDKS